MDEELAAAVADGIGVTALPDPLPRVLPRAPEPEGQTSKALSLLARPGEEGIKTRRVAILVANGTDGAAALAIHEALVAGDPAGAELVACECVVLAETKDHADWELIGECAKAADGEAASALKAAYDEVEDQEDEYLYHPKDGAGSSGSDRWACRPCCVRLKSSST